MNLGKNVCAKRYPCIVCVWIFRLLRSFIPSITRHVMISRFDFQIMHNIPLFFPKIIQLQNIVEILQTTLFLVQDSENSLQHPLPYHTCQHGVPAPDCTKTPAFLDTCPSSEDIKYRMTRVSVDCVDLYLAEAGTALNVQVF